MRTRKLALRLALLALASCADPTTTDAGATPDASADASRADGRDGATVDGGQEGFLAVSIENDTNCALHSVGAVCWGAGFDEPLVIPAPVDEVGAGSYFGCFLRGSTIECAASTYFTPDQASRAEAVEPGTYRHVSAGRDWACGVTTEGAIQCWYLDAIPPASPPTAEPIQQLRIDDLSACAITESWHAVCWDRMAYRIFALPESEYIDATTSDISARCGIDRAGEVHCVAGECRTDPSSGDDVCQEKTVDVDGADVPWMDLVGSGPGGAFTKIAMSHIALFVCGIRPDGQLVCWGRDYETYLHAHEPVGVRFRDIAAGAYHVCGVTLEGQLLCWGEVPFGRDWGQTAPPAWP